jgi:hypothetical protein
MQKWVLAVATLLAFACADPARAIVQETNTTVTKTGTEIAGDKITVTIEQPGRPAQSVTIQKGKPSASKSFNIDTKKPAKVSVKINDKPDPNRERTVDGAVLIRDGLNLSGLTVQTTPVTARVPSSTPVATPRTPIAPPADDYWSTALRYAGEFSGFYIGAQAGGSRTESTFTPTQYFSIGIAEPTGRVSAGGHSTDFNFGGSLGYRFPNLPISVQFTAVALNADRTIQGLPGNQFLASANDSLRVQTDAALLFTGFYYIPGFAGETWFLEGGGALVRNKFTHDCPPNGWCGVAPAAAPFTATDSQWDWGWVLGGGLEFPIMPILGRPAKVVLGYQHIFNEFDVHTGNPAIRAITGKVDGDIDRFYFGVNVAFDPATGQIRGGAPIGGAPVYSDIRLKRDIATLTVRADGIALYRYRYLWSDTEYVGVMAQEIAESRPDAVLHGDDGFLRVDYGKLGMRLMSFHEWNASKTLMGALGGPVE